LERDVRESPIHSHSTISCPAAACVFGMKVASVLGLECDGGTSQQDKMMLVKTVMTKCECMRVEWERQRELHIPSRHDTMRTTQLIWCDGCERYESIRSNNIYA
jgi:hypothetical protein